MYGRHSGAEVVHVHVAGHQELVVLEVVELDVVDRVGHVLLSGEEGLFPSLAALAHDARQARDARRQRAKQELRTERAAAQLGLRDQAAVPALAAQVRQARSTDQRVRGIGMVQRQQHRLPPGEFVVVEALAAGQPPGQPGQRRVLGQRLPGQRMVGGVGMGWRPSPYLA